MGALVKAVAMAHASGHDTSAHADAVNEYFRKNFRKLSRQQALDILLPLGADVTQKALCYDDKFWVWESLEEALGADL